MAECYNVACQYCVGYQCRRTCTCDIRLEAGEYVKVVRCKDCKWRDKGYEENCVAYNAFLELGDDGFCSLGERK